MILVGDRQMTLRGRTGYIGGNEQVILGGQTDDFRVDRQVKLGDEQMTLEGTDSDMKISYWR